MIIQTEIEIAAPPMKVWRALCDFGSYRKWNPCRDVVGVAGVGEKVTLMIGLDPKKRRKMPAIISAFEPCRALSFRTGRFFSSDTESFVIEPGRRGTLLRHSAELTGLSVIFMRGKWFESHLISVYDQVNNGLNRYVTSGSQLTMSARNRRRTNR